MRYWVWGLLLLLGFEGLRVVVEVVKFDVFLRVGVVFIFLFLFLFWLMGRLLGVFFDVEGMVLDMVLFRDVRFCFFVKFEGLVLGVVFCVLLFLMLDIVLMEGLFIVVGVVWGLVFGGLFCWRLIRGVLDCFGGDM